MSLGRILIVEDDEVVRFMTERLVKRTHFVEQAVFAGNGEQALEALRDDRFDLILLDIRMPVMDGFEFLDALARMRLVDGIAFPPIFIMSTSGKREDRERAARFPMVRGYLTKPFSKEHVDYLMGLTLKGADLKVA